jgi:hypothetical protein
MVIFAIGLLLTSLMDVRWNAQKAFQQELLGHINRAVPVLADPPKRFRQSLVTEQAY